MVQQVLLPQEVHLCHLCQDYQESHFGHLDLGILVVQVSLELLEVPLVLGHQQYQVILEVLVVLKNKIIEYTENLI